MGKPRVAFIHPDLGIGGAERLVVDAAIGLQKNGHEVVIYTSHCDKKHCFEEVKSGQLKVEVYGDHLPTNFGGKFFILNSNIRQFYLVYQLLKLKKLQTSDVFIIDQLSSCIPLINLFSDSKVLFYCHFPDQLLAKRESLIKSLYRIPFDFLEEKTIDAADAIVVNSNFTKSVFHKTFKSITKKPNVIYPCVDLNIPKSFDDADVETVNSMIKSSDRFYLSINRYERKKNISLALRAFGLSEEASSAHAKLIISGGYDERVSENVEYLHELQKTAEELKLKYTTVFCSDESYVDTIRSTDFQDIKIIFLTSIPTSLKDLLLSRSELLLYTPSYEHFGIVPLEAMKYGKAVLATNTGGPLETIESMKLNKNNASATGWCREPSANVWASTINEYIELKNGENGEPISINFKETGPARVKDNFSIEAMTKSFEKSIEVIMKKDKKRSLETFISTFILNLLFTGFLISKTSHVTVFALVNAILLKYLNFSYSSYWWMLIAVLSLTCGVANNIL